jgi:ERCC4-type nuclease
MLARHRVQIDFDYHEGALIGLLNQPTPNDDPNITTNLALNVGDVRIKVDGVTQVLIERKRVDDFYSSISGNRFREQRARMIQTRKRKPWLNLIYIFEGDIRSLHFPPGGRMTAQYLEQVQRELAYKYKIHVVLVRDHVATLAYIGHIQACFAKYGSPEEVLDGVTDADGTQVGRKRGINPKEFMRAVLTQISGVSAAKSLLIVNKYHNLPNLIHAYQRLENARDRELMLRDLKASEEARRFGPKLSAKVYNHVFGLQEEEKEDDAGIVVPQEEEAPDPAPAPHRQRAKKKQAVIMKRGKKMMLGAPKTR